MTLGHDYVLLYAVAQLDFDSFRDCEGHHVLASPTHHTQVTWYIIAVTLNDDRFERPRN